jgi:hypothetical protein
MTRRCDPAERQPRSARDRASCAAWLRVACVMAALVACHGQKRAPPSAESAAGAARAILASPRHANTIDTSGPYVVSLRRLGGEELIGGELAYAVAAPRGGEATARMQLAPGDERDIWKGRIPGAASGSTVKYWFVLETRDGRRIRHPAREGSAFRFRVVDVRAVTIQLPRAGQSSAVSITVEAMREPAGEVVLREFERTGSGRVSESRISLTVRKLDDGERRYALTAQLPELGRGRTADYFLEIGSPGGIPVSFPQGAPSAVYSTKRSAMELSPIVPDETLVMSVAKLGDTRWLARKGSGVWRIGADGRARNWTLGRGLPSGIARFVVPDQVAGVTYVGTNRGLVALGEDGSSWMPAPAPYRSAWMNDGVQGTARGLRFGPAAVSPLDGTFVFQAQADSSDARADSRGILYELDEGISRPLVLSGSGHTPLGWTAVAFDAIDGCWLLGGVVAEPTERAALATRCGSETSWTVLHLPAAAGRSAIPVRITALARDPASDDVLLGLELSRSAGGARGEQEGLFRLERGSGRLSPFAPGADALGAEVTCLATDARRGSVLAGTFGRGLWTFRAGSGKRDPRMLGREFDEITSLSRDEGSDAIVLGTSQAAYEIGPAGAPRRLDVAGTLPEDAIPSDARPQTRRVLLTSHRAGLREIDSPDDGPPSVRRVLRPGKDVPDGVFGDAKYLTDGTIVAALLSKGVLRIDDRTTRLFEPKDGLRSAEVLRILPTKSGDAWISHLPMPFGQSSSGALQLLSGTRITRTVRLDDRNTATVGGAIQRPENTGLMLATAAGVIEIGSDGSLKRMSSNTVSSIARNAAGNTIGVVGTSVERWDKTRFLPVVFRVEHPRWPAGRFVAGSPIDLAIDLRGFWYVLYGGGVLAVLEENGRFAGLLDSEDGIPATATRVLALPWRSGCLVGSSQEGLVELKPVSG